MRQFAGPIVGALVFIALQDFALPFIEFRGLVLGIMLVACVFLFPGGVAGAVTAWLAGIKPRENMWLFRR